jgi:hypothetical protein
MNSLLTARCVETVTTVRREFEMTLQIDSPEARPIAAVELARATPFYRDPWRSFLVFDAKSEQEAVDYLLFEAPWAPHEGYAVANFKTYQSDVPLPGTFAVALYFKPLGTQYAPPFWLEEAAKRQAEVRDFEQASADLCRRHAVPLSLLLDNGG